MIKLSFLDSNLLNTIISSLLYLGLLGGVWLIFGSDITNIFTKRTKVKLKFSSENKKSRLQKHIEMLLNITVGKSSKFSVQSFYFLTIALLTLSLFMLQRQSSLLFSILFSVGVALLPYVFLLVRLRIFRVKGSYEGELVVGEVLNQYKINYLNLSEALDRCIPYLALAPYSQKILVRLALQLKTVKSESELLDILDEFVFAIDTEWMKLLSNNFYLSLQDGLDISVSLADILSELQQARSQYEKSKRLNTESFSILKYLTPVMYGGSVWMAVTMADFTVAKFFDYQFNTATGFKMFFVLVSVFVVNLVIMVAFTKRKFDF